MMENGDANKNIQIAIPANIRFGFPPTRESIKLENKFTVLPLTIPLCDSMKDSYKVVSKITKKIK